jgi:hypothetical protein
MVVLVVVGLVVLDAAGLALMVVARHRYEQARALPASPAAMAELRPIRLVRWTSIPEYDEAV